VTLETKPSSAYKARRWLEDCWAIAHPTEGDGAARRRVDECLQVIEADAIARANGGPCCLEVHEFEAVCPRTGRPFMDAR
jgi:hypothetical protein